VTQYRGGDELFIDSTLAAQYEACSSPSECAAAQLLLESVILHEYTHYGDAQDGVDFEGGEEGDLFEIDAYGMDIDSLQDARDVLKKRSR